MRRAIAKAAFVIVALSLWGLLIVPTIPLADWMFRPYRRPDGLYPADGRKWIN